MWTYFNVVVFGAFIATYLKYGAGGPMDVYTCKGGHYLAIVNTLMTQNDSTHSCDSVTGKCLDTSYPDIRQQLCGATLTIGNQYWVAPCTILQETNYGKLVTANPTNCDTYKAFPICVSNFPIIAPDTTTKPKTTLLTTTKPDRCDRLDGWVTFGIDDYCVSNLRYSYTNANTYCKLVNSTLAKLSTSRSTWELDIIFNKLGIASASEVKLWANVTDMTCTTKRGCAFVINKGKFSTERTTGSTTMRLLCQKRSSILNGKTTALSSDSPSSSSKRTTPNVSETTSSITTTATTYTSKTVPQTTTTFITTSTSQYTSTSTSVSSTITDKSPTQHVTNLADTTVHADTISPYKGEIWKIIGQSEYFVIHKEYNYEFAYGCCNDTYGASLVAFLELMSYFEVFAQLSLSMNSFWVGASVDELHVPRTNQCTAFHNENQTMSAKRCSDLAFSVCRRSIYHNNTDQALYHPQFVQLLKEMTVEKSETGLNKRKLVSVDDKRPSAKTAGGMGAFILCFIGTTMLVCDLTRLKK